MRPHCHRIELPGSITHELPPLCLQALPEGELCTLEELMPEAEDMLVDDDADYVTKEQRKFDLAVHLAQQYKSLFTNWQLGNAIVAWIRQCEITFEQKAVLRPLLHPDVWPHAGRSTFVMLLEQKHLPNPSANVEKAVGLRNVFRHPPSVNCFSNQFLLHLSDSVIGTAYKGWAQMSPNGLALLPAERFHFQVIEQDYPE